MTTHHPTEPLTFDTHGAPLAVSVDRDRVRLHVGADVTVLSPAAAASLAAALADAANQAGRTTA
ncbi:hypothetical protein [uncultured Mycobacterium sp.]|uniref:hypothetical protein n=1 Tax=uncultured Mycobacterium sp. TaxID=171292 RepID=UPI0035C98F7A